MLRKFLLWVILIFPCLTWADGLSVGVTFPTGQRTQASIGATWTPPETARSGLNTSFVASDSPCKKITAVIYTNSSHPDGNPYGLMNEHNWGRGDRCYLTQSWYQFYAVVSALTNSQRGPTLGYGVGVEVDVLQLSLGAVKVTLKLGGEFLSVLYIYGPDKIGRERYNREIFAPIFPMGVAQVKMRLGKSFEAGAAQFWLPGGAAHLRAALVDRDPREAMRLLAPLHLMAPGSRGVTLFFTWTF